MCSSSISTGSDEGGHFTTGDPRTPVSSTRYLQRRPPCSLLGSLSNTACAHRCFLFGLQLCKAQSNIKEEILHLGKRLSLVLGDVVVAIVRSLEHCRDAVKATAQKRRVGQSQSNTIHGQRKLRIYRWRLSRLCSTAVFAAAWRLVLQQVDARPLRPVCLKKRIIVVSSSHGSVI